MTVPQHNQKNLLLRLLPPSDYQVIEPEFERLKLFRGDPIYTPGVAQSHVYFPETGMISITARYNPMKIEVGVIGREGFAGFAALLGSESSPFSTFVQLPGEFLRMPMARFLDFVREYPETRALLLRFIQAYVVQVSSTVLANNTLHVEQRLARWLLMVHDRSDGDRLLLTHDLIAILLGVRRPGVTVATHILEGEHAIRATRGAVLVSDRDRLRIFAGDSYGMAEAEYERLIGAPFAKASAQTSASGSRVAKTEPH